ncbi:MAG TPA: RCC1 domain-containing protein, partial [Nannocystis sp.]
QLGDGKGGTFESTFTPVDVSGLGSGVTAISAGTGFSTAVVSGGVKYWGAYLDGTLTPLDVQGVTADMTAVATGADFACALVNDGAVKCWGNNNGGQLGIYVNRDIGYHEEQTPVGVDSLP